MNTDHVYVVYILECINNIEDLIAKGRGAVENEKHYQAALLYYLQTMAESTQRLSDTLKAEYEMIDWIAISGFRNRLVHGYLDVNMKIVWNVIDKDLPHLKATIQKILKDIGHQDND